MAQASAGFTDGWRWIHGIAVIVGTCALVASRFLPESPRWLVDGLGVSGGMVGVLVIAPLVPHLSPLPALVLVSAFLIVAAIIGQFTPRARNRALEELSP